MLSLRIPLPGGIHGMPWERHVVVRGSICGMEACARLARKGMPACRASGHLSYPILVTLVTPPVVQIDLSTWQGEPMPPVLDLLHLLPPARGPLTLSSTSAPQS